MWKSFDFSHPNRTFSVVLDVFYILVDTLCMFYEYFYCMCAFSIFAVTCTRQETFSTLEMFMLARSTNQGGWSGDLKVSTIFRETQY